MVMSELFGSMVFSDSIMKDRLPKATYDEFRACCAEDRPLSLEIANVIASAMKDWAMEKGVTHFTHWFQPMTGITAEKHDSFITPAKNGAVIMEFSGKELIKGEPDASSFPSGGLRATFEARGYTAWDPTSNAFIKDGILCIPTAFCSYNGYALDKKTPLLRSMEAIKKQGKRLLDLFSRTDETLTVTVGAEQEYFLVDSEMFQKRRDLFYTGRTLFGAKAPKGQELNDHYFGAIKPRVASYMKELDEELWKLGILAKTKHNEAAPAQHELASIYTPVNISTDQNQLTMELMKKVARRHGMTCLLHEKPFEGINGSGKHNNWSLCTNLGNNLFEPGKSPEDNAFFLLMLAAVISSTDKYQDLLRISIASAGNDHRLGAGEAPPAIISIFLGEELTSILQAIADEKAYSKRANNDIKLGVHVLPKFSMDSTDRNRTSPFAFTGNKFEFRMPGSAISIACINMILNTIIADEFMEFADELEKTNDLNLGIKKIIRRVMRDHGRIIFNGNNYSEQWVVEAKSRGLLNLPSTMDALPLYSSEKNIAVFARQKVLSQVEIKSRQEILIENYCKLINIEANTMLDITDKYLIPAVVSYIKQLASTANQMSELGVHSKTVIDKIILLNDLLDKAEAEVVTLRKFTEKAHSFGSDENAGLTYQNEVLPSMKKLRAICDKMELNTAKKYWPFPSYGDLLFSVY